MVNIFLSIILFFNIIKKYHIINLNVNKYIFLFFHKYIYLIKFHSLLKFNIIMLFYIYNHPKY